MEILEKIKNKTVKVGIVGLGYVGLPLGLEFVEKDIEVLGFDVDEKKIPFLMGGKTYIKHIKAERIKNAVESGKFSATSDFTRLPEVDVIIICVPTPLNEHREPDMTYIVSTVDTIKKYLRKGQLVTLESTTYPGTTRELMLPVFENAGMEKDKDQNIKFKVGEDFYLAFSPEREDPNNPNYNTATIPKVVGGITANCLEVARALYNHVIVETVPVSSPEAAEATKLLENIYRSVNIALVNELKMVFDRMGIDIWEVINAAKTKPFGFNAFYPGPGLGGHCIPIDPFYLTWKAREFEINTKFIELAGEINTFQPYYVVEKAMEAMNQQRKTLNGSRILILGAAYKKNIDDMRESPSLKLIEIFRDKGAEVDYNDPYVPVLPKTRKYNFDMKSVELTKENISGYDLLVLSTDHDDYDYNFIHESAKFILDTRNAFKINGLNDGKVYKA
ncbi:MAG: nucleotide sugar dehydrogenase [Bacteroidetes bacterium]|nr:nucleotide sugar dehydrogenase [Bacteroidota bacterium]